MDNPSCVGLVVAAATALAVVAPFVFLGGSDQHDLKFHLQSWMEVADQWRQGIWYPSWATRANFGHGEPRFIFYPPGSWVLGAALSFVLPWDAIPGVFTFVALTFAGVSMHRLARDWLPPRDALLAAVLYTANPYHLVVVYWRGAFAELLVSAIFPLAVRYALSIEPESSSFFISLALATAAGWLCNAPAAVVLTYSLVLLLCVAGLRKKSPRLILRGVGAVVLGLVLAAFYVLPAAFERAWVNVHWALLWGLSPSDNFLFTPSRDVGHAAFNLLVSKVALAEIIIVGAGAAFSAGLRRRWPPVWWSLLHLALASTLLMFPVSAPVWKHFPELLFVQFPWRWLIPLGVTFAFFPVAAMAPRGRGSGVALRLCALVGLALIGWGLTRGVLWAPGIAGTYHREISDPGGGYTGTDEYGPRTSNHYYLPLNAPEAAILIEDKKDETGPDRTGAVIHVQEWGPERKRLSVDASRPATIALRLVNYPAWRVRVNGRTVEAESAPTSGQMLVHVSAGVSDVQVMLTRTRDRICGAVLSILALAAILLSVRLMSRRAARRDSVAGSAQGRPSD